MKCLKFKYLLFVFLLALMTTARCGTAQAAQKELSVFAAASLTESMNKIAWIYKNIVPEVSIVYNFDSSGTLKTQIEQGAECDLFISAAQKQMDQIDAKADPSINTGKLDFVAEGTRFDLVANKVVLIVPKGAVNKQISGFDDIITDKVSLIALGNSDVPVGQYSQEILTKLGLWEELNKQKKISFGGSVKEVLAQVAAAAADCGLVYGTDAATSPEVVIAAEAPPGSHRAITYPAAVLRRANEPEAVKAFAEFLRGPEATAIFLENGFSIPER